MAGKSHRFAWRRAALGCLALLAVTGAGRLLQGGPFVPELLAERIFAWVPMTWFRFFIGWLGALAKWVAFGTALVAYAASVAAGAWLWMGGLAARPAARWPAALLFGVLAFGVTASAFQPLARAGEIAHLWPAGGVAEGWLGAGHLLLALSLAAGGPRLPRAARRGRSGGASS